MENLMSDQRDEEQGHLPGEAGIWVFVLGDMLVFALFFATYLAYRGADIELYRQSQLALNVNYGAINTLFLLASSWCVVTAIQAARKGFRPTATRLIASAWLFGFAFAVVKVVEYSSKVAQGITPLSNEFFMFYFALTGIHFLHLLIGLGVLAFMFQLLRGDRGPVSYISSLESGATFWHLVDLLWIILFPLLYLMH